MNEAVWLRAALSALGVAFSNADFGDAAVALHRLDEASAASFGFLAVSLEFGLSLGLLVSVMCLFESAHFMG